MKFSAPAQLDLKKLAEGTDHLTPAMCASLAEAATICLSQHEHHLDGVLHVEEQKIPIVCATLDPRAESTHRDLPEATEDGAVGVAIALIIAGTGFDVVERSFKGTGFDWYLAKKDAIDPFENSACIEVSGILHEDPEKMKRRSAQKLKQVKKGKQDLPGYVVIVGFAAPQASVSTFS